MKFKTLTFTHYCETYDDIYQARWYQEGGYVELDTLSEPSLYTVVHNGLHRLIQTLEAASIPVERLP